MPLALGRLVLVTLGCFGPLRGTICAAGVSPAQHDNKDQPNDKLVAWDSPLDPSKNGLPASFPNGFALIEATNSRPPQVGFRRPQFELQKRDGTCLANGTNFCFGDANSYCSSCGTCCSSSSNGNNKWCCPSDGICCGSSCCASGQTCSNGQCYLPVETVTSTSFVAVTTTQVATKMVTVVLQIIENSITNSFVTVTNTNAETQTDWEYVTITGAAKRAEPTDEAAEDDSSRYHSDLALAGTAPVLQTASRTAAGEFTAPTISDQLVQELVKRQQAEESQNAMTASKSTTVVQAVVTTTAIISSTALSTTTVQTTSMVISTSVQTVTTVLNAKTTVSSISTLTHTPPTLVTHTLTEVATIPFSASLVSGASAPAATSNQAVLQPGGSTVAKKGLASGAVAGIAVGACFGALVAGLLAFFCVRRHRRNKKTLKSITEDYAYLGTGRSDSAGPPGVIHTDSQGPVMQHAIRYSGPPPPSAVAMAVGKPITRQVTMQSDDHGLPPTPNFTRMPTKRSARSSTSAASASSPISATSQSLPFGSDAMQKSLAGSQSGNNGRTSHMRSGSGHTNLTAASSTVVGGSARNSVQSTYGMAKSFVAAGGQPHKRASSSGGGSGLTVETLAEPVQGSSDASYGNAHISPAASPLTPPPPTRSAERPGAAIDPPSPYFEPRLGPLRIVNTPATPPTIPSIPEPDDLDLDFSTPPQGR